MSSDKNLEERIAHLELRNQRVELDKAWETNWVRRVSIMALTYFVVVSYLHFVVHNDNPLINGVVPVVGFLLSTFTVSLVKKIWLRRQENSNE